MKSRCGRCPLFDFLGGMLVGAMIAQFFAVRRCNRAVNELGDPTTVREADHQLAALEAAYPPGFIRFMDWITGNAR